MLPRVAHVQSLRRLSNGNRLVEAILTVVAVTNNVYSLSGLLIKLVKAMKHKESVLRNDLLGITVLF